MQVKGLRTILAPVLALTLSAACQVVLADKEQLAIEGSTTIYHLSGLVARQFMREHRDIRVSVGNGGSSEGIRALLAGEVDIANSSRFISSEELAAAMTAGIYPVPFRIADDCIIPVVHKSNKLKNLSREDLRRIYSGEIGNWKELGGEDRTIRVMSRDPGSGTFGVWRDLVMEDDEMREDAERKSRSSDVVRAVSEHRGAIGYIGLGHLTANIKPLRVDGVMGSLYSVRDGSYALSRPLFMFTRGWPEGELLEFINFALDPDHGQTIVRKSGFVPVHTTKN